MKFDPWSWLSLLVAAHGWTVGTEARLDELTAQLATALATRLAGEQP
ncbi:MAG TPA: hypothetical protein VFQ42_22115 [Mycobacterium sp.]|nr:hypothetical protein [Mycobacterium sp.]